MDRTKTEVIPQIHVVTGSVVASAWREMIGEDVILYVYEEMGAPVHVITLGVSGHWYLW